MAKKYGKQYITLLGDPLDTIHPSLTSLYNGDATAVALSATACVALSQIFDMGASAAMTCGLSVGTFNVLGAIVTRRSEVRITSILGEGRCINRKPSEEERANSMAKYGLIAQQIKDDYKKECRNTFVLQASYITLIAASSPEMALLTTTALVATSKRDISGAMRFKNVATGKWAIVDWPEPMEERQPQTTKLEPAYQRF